MAVTAAQLAVYDRIDIADCCAYLAGLKIGSINVVVCTDVIEYVGDLSGLFSAATGALRPGGYLIISAERLETAAPLHGLDATAVTPGFALLPTERYAHSRAYLQASAQGAGLSVVRLDALPCLREEEGSPLAGWLMFACRSENGGETR